MEVASNLSPTITGNIVNTDGPFTIAFRSGSDFAGYLDEVRLYPSEISSFMVAQRYADLENGLSSSSTISKYDTQIGEIWRCSVTPNDGLTDGSTSNTLSTTIVIDPDNHIPEASNLHVSPASPLSTDSLVAEYDYSDADFRPRS